MDIIHLLPDSVANQIAAGEVIQRPASVIKELVENSIDAGAANIDVYVQDAGRTCIQVIDDGKGMSETDARLAFERHATSKITRAEDLFTLRTMGFRGEALPSIVAVSQVTLQTRTPDSELGTRLDIEGGRILSQEPCVCAIGANFEVKNLFFNIPARRKFLKSNHTELNNIIQEFERIALVNHSVAFSLTCDGNTTIRLMATNLHRRIVDIFGKKIGADLITVEVDTTLVKIRGFVGRPESSKKKGAHQYFFVNGRYMRHPYFSKAVAESFLGLVPEGEQVPFFLYLDIDPENIDINISPTKTEVKFENEPAIWQIIYAGIKEALGKFNAVPVIDFDNANETEIPVMQNISTAPEPPRLNIDTSYNPFVSGNTPASNPTFNKSRQTHASAKDWTKLYEQLLPEADCNNAPTDNLFSEENIEETETSSSHFQYRGQYIVTATNSGLMIVDQHRAHVRILYDKYIKQLETRANITQGLLFPELISLPHSDSIVLEQIIEEVRSIGFDIENLGNGSFSINGMPTGTEGLNPQLLIQEIVATVNQGGKADLKNHRHQIALSLAKAAAIVVGQALTDAEMNTLLSDLFKSSNPNISPNGKTIITILKQNSIEKMFN
ncbi:MAG: DNA mismatch repair endonuclease MutL [Bacteroidaceae bacterium]|nr:DNA mismatch repair endonuclease MutL [Bacteroidaceae bacterium]